jgi:hypothetical protein
MRYSMLLFLAIIGIACAGGNRAPALALQPRRSANSIQPDDGPEFYHRRRRRPDGQARSRASTRAHAANALLVRLHFRRASRRRVDPAIREFHGT